MHVCVQIKAYADKNGKSGQEYAQHELSDVTLPSSFSTTFDPWSVNYNIVVMLSLHMISFVCIKLTVI